MKNLVWIIFLGLGLQANASEAICRIKATGTMNYRIQLAGGKTVTYTFEEPAESLFQCMGFAKNLLGGRIKISPQGYDWKGTGSLKVNKVKYIFKTDGFRATGIIR